MNIINSEDLFIFNLLTSEESLQLIEFLKLYAEICADHHDPEFILLIENERVRSAFTYFNNRFARRRPKKKPAAEAPVCEAAKEMVKSPSEEAIEEPHQTFHTRPGGVRSLPDPVSPPVSYHASSGLANYRHALSTSG